MCCEHCRPEAMKDVREGRTLNVRASGGRIFRSADCTCRPWGSILPAPPCPVHGQHETFRVVCGS